MKKENLWSKLLKKAEVDHHPGLNWKDLFLQNEDLKPVEPKRRLWGWKNFVALWIADSFNINTWMIAATYVQAGLSWWEVWISVWVGYFIAGMYITITGRIGAMYHISFPVACRASFGIWGSFWPVINRVVMACIWYAVQSWIGGECVRLMILSIWPSARNMHNGLSESSGTNTLDFMCFFLFWVCSLPALWFPIHQIRHLFTAKSCLAPIAGIAFLIWTLVKAHGVGDTVHQKSTLKGSEFSWMWVGSMMSCIANFATLIVNDCDFSRFATKPISALWSQLIAIPVCFGLTSLIGVLVSSASGTLYGQPVWNPLTVLDYFLDEGTSRNRAGVFFIAAIFALAQLGTNISANSASAGTDLTALFPRFLNIRRGSFICAAIAFMICPWQLLSSSNNFTNYLSAYSVFLSSIAGVIVSDYYAVRKGYLNVPDLYSMRKGGPFRYFYGFSWRGYAAYIAGILINVVGFAGAVGNTVPIGATYIYNVNFFCGFFTAFIVYYVVCLISPIPGANSKGWHEIFEDEINLYPVDHGEVIMEEGYGPQGVNDDDEYPKNGSNPHFDFEEGNSDEYYSKEKQY